MANETTKMGLTLPDETEFYNVGVFNENFRKLEEHVTNDQSKLDEHIISDHVTGVKGSSESSYRKGLVNITKDSVGLNNVDNTSDANKSVKTATKLATARSIDGVLFDGSASVSHYAICSTAGSVGEKVVSKSGFSLVVGAEISVKFSNTILDATAISLNVNNTGAKRIYMGDVPATNYHLTTGIIYHFVYDGSVYRATGIPHAATENRNGLMTPTMLGNMKSLIRVDVVSMNELTLAANFDGQTTKAVPTVNGYTPIAVTPYTSGYPDVCWEDCYLSGDTISVKLKSLRTSSATFTPRVYVWYIRSTI